MSIETKVKLLWNSAKSLEGDLHVHKLLKSYYINTCRKLAKNLQIPKEKFSPLRMCPYCGCFWNEIEYELKLVSKQLNNSSKTRRLIGKFDQVKSTSCKILNKSQKNRAKWLRKKCSNHLSINCGLCKSRSLLKMENPKNETGKHLLNEKRRNRKEISAADIEKVSREYHNQKSKTNSSSSQKISTSTSVLSKTKKEKLEDKSLKISKSKNKKNVNTGASNKVVSKTQKQNTLIQLATLLQKQSKDDTKNSAQKRLQSFLK